MVFLRREEKYPPPPPLNGNGPGRGFLYSESIFEASLNGSALPAFKTMNGSARIKVNLPCRAIPPPDRIKGYSRFLKRRNASTGDLSTSSRIAIILDYKVFAARSREECSAMRLSLPTTFGFNFPSGYSNISIYAETMLKQVQRG